MTATVMLKAGRSKPAIQRHPWVFSGAVQRVTGDVTDGDVVRVVDHRGGFLAWAYINRRSQIVLRLLSWDEQERIDEGFLLRHLEKAVAWRRERYSWPPDGAARLVYAESDGLPGLVIDRYASWYVVQFLTLGSERWREPLVDWLSQQLGAEGIYERSDVDVREKEGLPLQSRLLWGPEPTEVEIEEDGYHYLVDIAHGQKTGFFLDQRLNRQRVARYAQGRHVLNCFAYTGGFGICAAGAGAREVWHVDTSAEALQTARRNAALNGLPVADEHFVQADVFQLLREYRDGGQQFDMIVLDPPKFAFSQSQVQRACRGYKDINLLAMQLLRPDGILATFSCSGAISQDLFQKVLFGAALDAQRAVQIVENLTQAPDHPILLSFPEAAYLKGLVCRAL